MQSNNCGMRMYVLVDPNFKYTISWLVWHLFPPFCKDGGRQYKCHHISNSTSPKAILLTLLDSLVDSDIKTVIRHLQQHNNSRHF